jgi:hypothetical protein
VFGRKDQEDEEDEEDEYEFPDDTPNTENTGNPTMTGSTTIDEISMRNTCCPRIFDVGDERLNECVNGNISPDKLRHAWKEKLLVVHSDKNPDGDRTHFDKLTRELIECRSFCH